jgi:hypothetical protein
MYQLSISLAPRHLSDAVPMLITVNNNNNNNNNNTNNNNNNNKSVVLVRERTISTERPPIVREVCTNFCG